MTKNKLSHGLIMEHWTKDMINYLVGVWLVAQKTDFVSLLPRHNGLWSTNMVSYHMNSRWNTEGTKQDEYNQK